MKIIIMRDSLFTFTSSMKIIIMRDSLFKLTSSMKIIIMRDSVAKLLEPGDGMRGVRHECVTKLWRSSFDSNCHPGSGKPRRLRNLAQM